MELKRPCPRCGVDTTIRHQSFIYVEDQRCDHCHADTPADIGHVLDAVQWAITRHHGQYRSSADGAKIPYVSHCIEVARMVSNFAKVPAYVLEAAVLHDIVEDTDTKFSEIRRVFGGKVERIVDTLTTDGPGISVKQKLANQRRAIPGMTFYEKVIKVADKTSNVKSIADFEPAWKHKNQLGYVTDASEIVECIRESSWSRVIHNMADLFRLEKTRALQAVERRKELARS